MDTTRPARRQCAASVSRSASKWLLWAALLLSLPLPFYMGAQGLVPPVRALFLAGIATGMLLTEGAHGTSGIFAGLGLAQGLAALLLSLGLAALLARLAWRLAPARARTPVVLALACAMLGAALLPIYDTPLSSSRARSSLLQAFR